MDPDAFHTEIKPWLRLHATAGIGALTAAKLLRHFGDAQTLFATPISDIAALIGAQKANALAHPPAQFDTIAAQCLQWLQGAESQQHRAIWTCKDRRYPPNLLETADPPVVIFAQGAPRWLAADEAPWHTRQSSAIAIVGSRSPTQQGKENARHLAQQLQQLGITIVSGMALGIDAAAHEGALIAPHPIGPPTIAVLGTGIDCIYPRQNTALYHAISTQGLVLSEYAIGTPAQAHNFPKRNRIITGMTQGTLVVEAALQSGSLISARLAAEQGKEVFAIPGSIHAHQSKGCHFLIKQGAKLVECLQDVLDELPHLQSPLPSTGQGAQAKKQSNNTGHNGEHPLKGPSLNPMPPNQSDQNAVLQALGSDPCSLDAIMARTGMSASIVQMHLLELELAGWVERLPGGSYQRLHRS